MVTHLLILIPSEFRDTNGLVVIRYDKTDLKSSVQGDKFGKVIIFHTNTPNTARKYFEENMSEYLERIHVLGKSVLVELKNDRIVEEKFNLKFSADHKKVDKIGLLKPDPCSGKNCLDLKVPDVNLIPILKKGNAIKVETFIDPDDTPNSFQLKGFIEFEVKIKSKL